MLNRFRIWDDYILVLLLIFIVCSFPRVAQIEKYALILLLIILSLIHNGRIVISKGIVNFLMFWIPYAVFTVFVGIIRNNSPQGITDFIKVNFVDVALWILLISIAICNDFFVPTMRAITFSAIYLGVYNIVLTAGTYMGFSVTWLQRLDATSAVGHHIGYSHIVSTNLSMAMFLFPLLLFSLRTIEYKGVVNERTAKIALVLCAMAMVLSGRRMVWIALIISVLVFVIKNMQNPMRFIKYVTSFALLAIIAFLVLDRFNVISVEGLIERFMFAFSKVDEYGFSNVRMSQSDVLIDGFMNSPVWGNGAGAVTPGYFRSSESPWMFELSYHAILFQSGLLGFFFYGMSIFSIGRTIKKMTASKEWITALMVTLIVVIISNSTNPYFSSSFDFMIWLMGPLLLAHYATLDKLTVGDQL